MACVLCHRQWRSRVWNICPHCDPDESEGNVTCVATGGGERRSVITAQHCRRREWAAECKAEHALLFGRWVKGPTRVQ